MFPSFSVHFHQSLDKKPFTDIRAKQKKKKKAFSSVPYDLVLCHLFGLFRVCSSMSSLSLTSSTTKHTFDTQHKLKQKLKQGRCVFFVVVGFVLFCFRCCYLRFEGFFLIILHGLSASRCCCRVCSTCSSFFHRQTNIYSTEIHSRGSQHIRHLSVDARRIYSPLTGCGEGWVPLGLPVTLISGQRPLWQMTLSAQLFTATQGSYVRARWELEALQLSSSSSRSSAPFTGGSPRSLSDPCSTAPCP